MNVLKRKSVVPVVLAFFVLTAAFAAVGCGSKNLKYSGFLDSYDKMAPDEMDKGDMFWQDPDVSIKSYTKFMIDPISFHMSPELQETSGELDAELANKMAAYFKETITKTLAPEYEVVENVGPDVGRLRIALTGVTVERKSLKAYQFIPVALVVTGAMEATGIRDRVTVLGMEGELLDSTTGKVLGAVVQQSGTASTAKNMEEVSERDVYPTLDHWAQKLKKRLVNAK